MKRVLPGIVCPVLVLLMLCAVSGCGRKAKPEPLRSALHDSYILTA